jgi:PAS domain S-box-containing protein
MVNNEREITITEKAAELRRANEELRVELEECRRVESELRESESRHAADALRRAEFEYQSQSEARFRILAETTPSAIIVHRLDEAEILYVNPAMEEISGYSRSELLNLTLWDLIHPDCVEVVAERRLARLRGDMVPPRLELKLVTKGGEARWVDQSIGAIEFEGAPALIVTAFDVTDRKLAEEALRRSEERYRALVENTPDIIARYDRDGRYLFVNSAIGRVSPLRPEDFIGKTLRDIVFTQEQASFREEVIRKVFETGKPFETEFELQGLSGIDVYDWRVYPEFDSNGNMQSVLSINRNITERRRAAEALRLSEERYRLIVENQTEFIVKWLPDGTRTFVNESYCRYFGISEQECVGTSFFPLVEPEFREAIRRNTASLTPETPEYTEEHQSIVSNGKRWQQWTSRGIFDQDGHLVELLSTGRDITERKTAEEALQDSETRGRLLNERFSLAVDSAGIGVWDLNLITNELSWDQQMYRLYQVDPAEFSGAYDAWVRGVHPDDLPRAEAESKQAIDGARPFDTAFRVVWPNGEARDIRAFARVVVDERGSPIRMIGINYDITDRIRVEESLRKSEAHYRALVENTPDIIARFDRDCRYMFINSAVAQVSSIKPEDFVGKAPREVGFSDEQASFREGVVRRVFETQMPFETEFEFEGADGRRTFEWRVYPEFDETGSVQTALSINRDITDRRNAEVEVRQSREQLRALSSHLQVVREEERTHIAREVHDELGQALTALKIDLYSLQRDLAREAPSEANRLADKIKSMSSLIDTTIHAVRRIATELRPGILDDLGLVAAIEWQANDFQSRTGINCEVASAVEYVELDRDRSTAAFRILQETLTNVARHASASRVGIELKQDDKNLVMEVTDNGKGITASDISGSKSLGLLGMCERAQLLGGDLMISGGVGEGTRVTVSIPL